MARLPLNNFGVCICNSQVSAELRQTQKVVDAGSIRLVTKVVPGVSGQMVDLNIVADVQQLVQGLLGCIGIHV
jgi:hypothetical protein